MKILMLVAIKSLYTSKGFDSFVSISDLVSTFSSIRFFLPSFHKIGKKYGLTYTAKTFIS